MFNVEIIDFLETTLPGMSHKRDYQNIGRVFEKIGLFAVTHDLYTESTQSVGVYYDEPKTTAPSELLTRIHCLFVKF